jgi:hypothetical protein
MEDVMANSRTARNAILGALAASAAVSLSGCYVLPVTPEGYPYAYPAYPAPPSSPAAYPAPLSSPPASVPYAGAPAGQIPASLPARLYPANEIATQTGVIHGTVTNMMTGKGRFQLSYRGETLSGEATRVDGDSRRGVASAYGSGGAYMSCEYQMRTPQQGAGTCQFSNGAKYQVHIGS